jgi:adenylate cyclase
MVENTLIMPGRSYERERLAFLCRGFKRVLVLSWIRRPLLFIKYVVKLSAWCHINSITLESLVYQRDPFSSLSLAELERLVTKRHDTYALLSKYKTNKR